MATGARKLQIKIITNESKGSKPMQTKYNVSVRIRTPKGEDAVSPSVLANEVRAALRNAFGDRLQGVRAEVAFDPTKVGSY